MSANVLRMGIPTCLAQIVNLLYNLVDRVYIGHIPGTGALALTGLGVCLPVISLVTAFTNLCGQGGAPLVSIARGCHDDESAKGVVGSSFAMLLIAGLAVPALFLCFLDPLLLFFGASEQTLPYARDYLVIYLLGTEFVMIASGMNYHINAQGFARTGLLTVALGAVLNIALDPLFIYALDMGVRGAAVATVISQAASTVWVLLFLRGRRIAVRLELSAMRLRWPVVRRILGLGSASFVFGVTNSLVELVTNRVLLAWGGDVSVGVMTVLMSLHDIFMMVPRGITQGCQPVFGYNYGAGLYERVRAGIRFVFWITIGYCTAMCLLAELCPALLFRIYTSDETLLSAGRHAMRLYMSGFWIMGLQFVGQNTFTALGKSKQAVFFSLLRKAFIVVPATLLLPRVLGVTGVYLAEPLSDYLGSVACFATMMLTVYRALGKKPEKA